MLQNHLEKQHSIASNHVTMLGRNIFFIFLLKLRYFSLVFVFKTLHKYIYFAYHTRNVTVANTLTNAWAQSSFLNTVFF